MVERLKKIHTYPDKETAIIAKQFAEYNTFGLKRFEIAKEPNGQYTLYQISGKE